MSNSLLDIGKLSEPLTKLVETVAAGIGGLYAPVGTVRQAKADAKAAIIRAEGQTEVASIELGVKHRLEHLEAIRQENIEGIVAQAALEMPEAVSSHPVSRDWTLQFLALAQDVCDEEMQRIWARILAGEVASPGSFGKRTLEFLKTLEKEDAEYFTLLSGFAFLDKDSWPLLVIDKTMYARIYEMAKADLIGHFADIGLLSGADQIHPRSLVLGRRYRYFGRTVEFTVSPKVIEGLLEDWLVLRFYTAIGAQLFHIAGAQPVPDYVETLSESLRSDLVDVELRIVADREDLTG